MAAIACTRTLVATTPTTGGLRGFLQPTLRHACSSGPGSGSSSSSMRSASAACDWKRYAVGAVCSAASNSVARSAPTDRRAGSLAASSPLPFCHLGQPHTRRRCLRHRCAGALATQSQLLECCYPHPACGTQPPTSNKCITMRFQPVASTYAERSCQCTPVLRCHMSLRLVLGLHFQAPLRATVRLELGLGQVLNGAYAAVHGLQNC